MAKQDYQKNTRGSVNLTTPADTTETTDAAVDVATVTTDTTDTTAIVDTTPIATADTPTDAASDTTTDTNVETAVDTTLPDTADASSVVSATATAATTGTVFSSVIDNLRNNGTPAQKQTIWRLDDYAAKMAPGLPQTEQTGTQNQLSLWHLLDATINLDQAEFKQCWGIILLYFKELKQSVFADQYVARFFNSIRLDETSSKAFQHLLDICTLTADAATRSKVMRQIDLNRALSIGVSDKAKANIISFYN